MAASQKLGGSYGFCRILRLFPEAVLVVVQLRLARGFALATAGFSEAEALIWPCRAKHYDCNNQP